MALEYVFDDGEAKAGSPCCTAAARIGAIEAPGQVRNMLFCNSITLVFYGQRDRVVFIGL